MCGWFLEKLQPQVPEISNQKALSNEIKIAYKKKIQES